MRFFLSVIVLLLMASVPAQAVNPNEVLADPELEARARDISKGLRCVVCQNQSIDDSDASLARDLRVLVRERLTAGDTNEQVVTYVVSRYGDFVLLKPPFNLSTLALWLGPLFLIIFGLVVIFIFFRKNQQAPKNNGANTTPLTNSEKRRLAELLAEDSQ